MLDINIFKVENKLSNGFWRLLNPKNWGKKQFTEENVNILFVDDMDMPVVKSLKKAGFNVKKVNDIKNIEDAEVLKAQIIFVDFDGVGKTISPKYQGAGLIKELKVKYSDSKYIVLYTAQPTLPTEVSISELFKLADAKMRKDSDVTDFKDEIKKALKKIK